MMTPEEKIELIYLREELQKTRVQFASLILQAQKENACSELVAEILEGDDIIGDMVDENN